MLRQTEQIVGISAILVLIFGTYQAYQHSAVFPLFWLQIYIAVGLLWASLYVGKVVVAYRNGKLFFTKNKQKFNISFLLVLMFFLIGINSQRSDSTYQNIRYVMAFSFFLIAIANFKNYINFNNFEQIDLSYQSKYVKWENVLDIDKTPNGYGIKTQLEGKFAILNEDLLASQFDKFQTYFDAQIESQKDDFDLSHFVE